MIESYDDLVSEIANTLSRNDLLDQVPSWVQTAEQYIIREARVPDGEYFTTGTFVVDQAYIDMPRGFKRPRHIEVQGSPLRILEHVDMTKRSDVLENDSGGTIPRSISYLGRRAWLAPVPKSAETYHLFYYGKPPPLGPDNPTSELLEHGVDALMYQALTYSAPFLGEDERIVSWQALAAAAVQSVKKDFWDGALGAGVIRQRPDFAPADQHR